MAERTLTYFVSDVHLGCKIKDPVEREARFLRFLRSIPADRTAALYLLGDIWDFWYEYRDVIPKDAPRVIAALMDLKDAGVDVCFIRGNHDKWTYRYFEDSGIRVLEQPCFVEIGGKTFCLGHGDGLGPVDLGYRVLNAVFSSRITQCLFSSIHPTLSFRLGRGWSESTRKRHIAPYEFRGEDEPLCKFALECLKSRHVDYFIFGHYHTSVDLALPGGAKLMIMKDWIDESPYLYFSGTSVFLGHSINME